MGGDPEQEFSDAWSWKIIMHELSGGDIRLQDYWDRQTWIRFLNELAFRKEMNFVNQQKIKKWQR